ncbi:hypothetical protein QJQ45_004343 [Haematococcus lacustris]|nr:hypothetical protein QJQ45_004343 [Haematococcus lacustris]
MSAKPKNTSHVGGQPPGKPFGLAAHSSGHEHSIAPVGGFIRAEMTWSLRHAKDVRGLKWCHQLPPNPPPPPPAQDQPPAQPPPGPVPRSQAPPRGRWLDRDTNPCLNFLRIGESMQRPIELCQWDGLEAWQ